MRDGDADAYGVLYERHAGAARGLARQLLRGEAEAEDAVAEAFARVLGVIRRGRGPTDCFRPYLLTAVRNAAYDRGRRDRRQIATDDLEALAPGEPFHDPAVEGLERALIARAFRSLPERWQTVLWHTEIEGAKPSEAAPVLGMRANSVAALAYRAREGLRQAYLQMHLVEDAPEACRPTLGNLGAYVRGGLGTRDTGRVDDHLDLCAHCRAIHMELMDVNLALRGTVLPLVAGLGATGYLAAGGVPWAWLGRLRRVPKQAAGVGAGASACLAAVVALALTGGEGPVPDPSSADPAGPPAAAEPDPASEPGPAGPRAEPGRPPAPPSPEGGEPAATDTPERPAEADEPVFSAGIDPVGALVPGSDGIMVMDVRNLGGATADDVVAVITLPPGVEMASSGGAGHALPHASGRGDWSCFPGSGGGRCVLSAMAAGQSSTQFIDVRVHGGAGLGVPASVSVTSGGAFAVATGNRGVSAEGVAARYAAAGRVRAESVGNSLATCAVRGGRAPVWPWPLSGSVLPGPVPLPPPISGTGQQANSDEPCALQQLRQGVRSDNDHWEAAPLDLDRNPGTASSTSAFWELPEGGSVLWAGLYFSGSGSPEEAAARVRGPDMDGYRTVRARDVGRADLPGYPAYQAFAEVTDLVRQQGGGQWWVADVPAERGRGTYAGWGLVVVMEDPSVGPRDRVMVLDGTEAVFGGGETVFPVSGLPPAAVDSEIGVIAWEGDAGLAGDRLTVDGTALAPVGGPGTAENAFTGSARGAVGDRTGFGTDVLRFDIGLGRESDVRIRSDRDALLLGAVVVTAPTRG
ncbi:sigma-70 family RNA polymerase sigma factor [Nocardiopsis sp. CNT312]|uniref:sigma-70 family RNA polymerase sigma factor n=1 Tax=Nocardiopsis sp. CNT312 TaxID=1137268 RepID=UPI001E63A09C|nr:sigma-70 family RNA polymerase sigma factor [Nocardiopsis sp. CNT312]